MLRHLFFLCLFVIFWEYAPQAMRCEMDPFERHQIDELAKMLALSVMPYTEQISGEDILRVHKFFTFESQGDHACLLLQCTPGCAGARSLP